ncbi:hypothetical protein ABIB00_007759 [Bradyrhizobium sp. LB14.3]
MIMKVTSEDQRYLRSAESAYERRTPAALLGPPYVSAGRTFDHRTSHSRATLVELAYLSSQSEVCRR